jgi:hypothetical protein
MAFYDLDKVDRDKVVLQITHDIAGEFKSGTRVLIHHYFSDQDTYIRKTAYIAVGRIYLNTIDLQQSIINTLSALLQDCEPKVRQTAVNAAGEIGKSDFAVVQPFFDTGLFDEHHSVRNAVIGSMKKMGEKNPGPVLEWSAKYLHHSDKEIRREICHGIELRGRTHPQDILPLLRELQFDTTKRVRSTLVHVIGQIAYKKGCLETVMDEITTWDNSELVKDAIAEIIDVHHRYRNFTWYTQDQARAYINKMIS